MNLVLADEQDDPLPAEPLLVLAEVVLRAEGYPDATEMSIVLVDEARIAELNQDHLGRHGPTDVLSFPVEDLEPGVVPVPSAGGPPLALGDVYICPAVVRRRADATGVPLDDEMGLMVVHGILHLLGYDHGDDSDAEYMEGRERTLLEASGRSRW
ncbi:MAG TPA: rRNA maturation RNase YbeY [Acidimicrobiia bacterium]|jgi:probable rRNA maturation factor